MNTENPQPIANDEPELPQPALGPETAPEPEPMPAATTPPPLDPDTRLPYIALTVIVLFLILCVAFILIAYNNGPA